MDFLEKSVKSGGRPARVQFGVWRKPPQLEAAPPQSETIKMAGNDAEREERLVACLNILRRTPTKDAEEVRYRWTAGRIKDTAVMPFCLRGVCLLLHVLLRLVHPSACVH